MDEFPRIELRTPRLHLTTDSTRLPELADLARDGIHDPGVQPFGNAWTDTTPEGRAQSVHAWWRGCHFLWDPADWHLPFIAQHDDDVIGVQEIGARDFKTSRTVRTGSWLGARYQRQGFGTEMRAAVLYFAFTVPLAHYAETSAHEDNAGSNGVSRRLGYRLDATSVRTVRGTPTMVNHYALSFSTWLTQDGPDVQMSGDPEQFLRACGLLNPGPV